MTISADGKRGRVMSSGMNTEQAKEYAKTMTYSQAVSNIKHGKGIKYRKATMIKLRELAEIADRLDRKDENCSEKPNNCEHITEDGVTCAKYPACDDCIDNPLNKVKGSERLVKGSEQTDCYMCKWLGEVDVCGRCRNRNLFAKADTEPTISKMEQVDKDINVRSKDKPNCEECKHFHENAVMYLDQCDFCFKDCKYEPKDEPQTDMAEDIVRSYGFKAESYQQAKAKDEPQPMTDAEITEFAKEIVHEMIDNSVIAEDAYPDLKQRMHEAVERLDEYYPSEDERNE